MNLVLYAPVAVSPEGFPRNEQGRPYLPGEAVRQAVFTAVFVYATRRDRAFRERVRREVTARVPNRALPDLLRRLEDLLLHRWPWLVGLHVPDIPLRQVERLRVLWIRLEDGQVEGEAMLETTRDVLPLPVPCTGEQQALLDAAGRSFTEALADAEWRWIRDVLPQLEPFYQDLKGHVLKHAPLPLRVGYWTDDPYQGRLLAFWRVPEVRRVVRNLYRRDPRPSTVLYAPRLQQTLGWSWWGEVTAL